MRGDKSVIVREPSKMALHNLIVILVVLVSCATGEIDSSFSYGKEVQQIWTDIYKNYYSVEQGSRVNLTEKVHIQLYYECLCGDCRNFDTTQFKEVVQKLNKYLNIRTYPYGNAETFDNNGKYVFKCQHGPSECYGNKLHACALNIVQNQTKALFYNSCMMDFSQTNGGSDDIAADQCATSMNIESKPIKACAKGEMGTKLLKHYGDESKRANFHYVPYILVNGRENDGSNFMRDVCAAYADPPPPCAMFVQ